ncbi:AAA family ATPase [Antarctobacter jejuensis]|uniref:AAA family ATPase n=1 Tax=Antarctobacter jejuensis TaxID=1439938 RepID=UPI003FD32683
MPKIKIIHVQNLDTDERAINKRLRDFLRETRQNRLARELIGDDANSSQFDEVDLELFKTTLPEAGLTYKDEAAIAARVRCLVSKRHRATGTAHLSKDDLARLSPEDASMEAVMAPSEHRADEIAAALHAQMPWMGRATECAWHDLRRAARRGTPIKIAPMVINGPPGIGKSAWTRALADQLELPLAQSDAGAGSAGFDIVGVERGWSSAQPGRPVNLLLDHRIANPIFVVDEICKAGVAISTQGRAFSMTEAMLGLMEPGTARAWNCPYFRVTFDMSHVSWLFTSNKLSTVPEPFLSRCQIVEVRDITPAQLHDFAVRRGLEMKLSQEALEAVCEALVMAPRMTGRRMSLRDVVRMLERAETLEGRPRLQ